jgi:oligosaccharyl transferase (archaeosortase A-associated)
MGKIKLSPGLLSALVLVVFAGAALYFRAYLPYHQVFSGDEVKFTGPDAYYHMRLVDNLVHHFPLRINFDPYTYFPQGTNEFWPPFYDWLIAGIALLIGLGSPTERVISTVGAWVPVVLGLLTVIPVYIIGKELFNRWVGVLAASLLMVLPGRFLADSILGAADHHVAEALFSTTVVMFLVLAIKAARQRGLELGHLRRRDWKTLRTPLVYAMLAGLSLGVYLLTWVGGLMFVLLVFLFFVVQMVIDHLNNRPLDHLVIIGPTLFLVTALVCVPVLSNLSSTGRLCLPSLTIAFFALLAMTALSRLMRFRNIRAAYYPLAVAGLGMLAILAIHLVNPTFIQSALHRLGIFTPGQASQTIMEVKPLLFPYGTFSLSYPWLQFNTSFFLSLISLGVLIFLAIKRGEASRVLLIIWSLFILAATLGQTRFVYYFGVNVALLTGFVAWQILKYFEFSEPAMIKSGPPGKVPGKKTRNDKTRRTSFRPTARRAFMVCGALIVFFLCYFPSIKTEGTTISTGIFTPADTLYDSLTWLRENSPEPFGDADYYYQLYQEPPAGQNFEYPPSAYGVIALWDYGHWITSIARRIPVSNPFQQGATEEARFFVSQDEAAANETAANMGVRYVLVDKATVANKFHTLPAWTGEALSKYKEVFYQNIDGQMTPSTLYYPEYFRSLAVRLYTFAGKAITPKSALVISYDEKTDNKGQQHKEVTSLRTFSTYEMAVTYVAEQKSGNYRIGSFNASASPVALEALQHYNQVYSSPVTPGQLGATPDVRIFEYVK